MDSIRPPFSNRPKNRIEEAIKNSQIPRREGDDYLPQIKKPAPEKLISNETEVSNVSSSRVSKKRFNLIKVGLVLSSLVVLVGLVAYLGYFGVSKTNYSRNSNSAFSLIKDVNNAAKVALPTDEAPTIVTVSKLEPLKDQPIFRNAELGDILLIYTKAKRAILFRPGMKLIIEDAILTD